MVDWTPKDAGDIVGFWYDAADRSTILNAAGNPCADGEKVARWLDKSVSSGCRTGTPRHAVMDTVSKQPIYQKVAAKGSNGMPAVATPQYQAGRMVVTPAMPVYNNSVGQAAFVVGFNPGSDFGPCTMFSSGAATGSDASNDNGGPQLRYEGNGVRFVRSYQADLGQALNNLAVDFHVAGFNAGSSKYSIYADGQHNDQNSNPGFTNPLSLIFSNINGAEPFVGPIQEIIGLTRRLSADECDTFTGYLAWKWLTYKYLLDNHRYKTSRPQSSVTVSPAPLYRRRQSGLIF